MVRRKLPWSWAVFISRFWIAFGGLLAVFVLFFLVLALFADTSSASFGTVIAGLLFAVACSVVYGASKGDEEVREWRERLDDKE